jgi:hypothetical protein
MARIGFKLSETFPQLRTARVEVEPAPNQESEAIHEQPLPRTAADVHDNEAVM